MIEVVAGRFAAVVPVPADEEGPRWCVRCGVRVATLLVRPHEDGWYRPHCVPCVEGRASAVVPDAGQLSLFGGDH